MAIVAVIAFSGTQNSGAAPSLPTDTASADKVVPEHCPGVRKALRFYTKRWQHWTTLRTGAGVTRAGASRKGYVPIGSCPRYLLKIRKLKAVAAHREWNRYFAYHYVWSEWLPDKWQRIGACETGYGQRPGNWRHQNSRYGGAFGFALSSWTAFVPYADPKAGPYPSLPWLGTPRQQYEVALAIWRRYGFSGWGCRGA